MNKIKFIIVCLGLIIICGCSEKFMFEESLPLKEEAKVLSMIYTPSYHGSGTGIGPTLNMSSGGMGIAITSVTIHVAEKYAILFQCQHGKFVIECDNDEGRMRIWNELKKTIMLK